MLDLRLFVPFSKRDAQPDGSVIVEGIATKEEIDKQGEVVTYEASKAAFAEWTDAFSRATGGMSLGNIREMHGPVAAGKAIAWDADDATKAITLRAKIVDKAAAEKVREGVYTGFSIGAPGSSVIRDMVGDLKRIVGYKLSETSLVDNPACPSALFSMAKRAVPITWTAALLKAEMEAKRLHAGEYLATMPWLTGDAIAKGLNDGALCITAERAIEKVAAREDASPKEGESKYGDVTFADEQNKKYPIDTAAHVRAAWNYINKEKNAAKYGAKDLSTIKRRIIGAWKRMVGKDGPPAAQEKAFGLVKWQDGLSHLQTLAGILASLDSLLECVEHEAVSEGDASTVPGMIREAEKQLSAILTAMCAEETSELFGAEADEGEMEMLAIADVQKVVTDSLAPINKLLEPLQKLETLMKETVAPIKDELAKVQTAQGEAAKATEALTERLAKVEATPAAVGRPVATVEKTLGQDRPVQPEGVSVDAISKVIAEAAEKMGPVWEREQRLKLATLAVQGLR